MRFKVRDAVAARLNARLKPHIRVSVAQNADPEDYRKFLETNLRGIGIQHNRVAASISKAISPQELGELVQAGERASLARRRHQRAAGRQCHQGVHHGGATDGASDSRHGRPAEH